MPSPRQELLLALIRRSGMPYALTCLSIACTGTISGTQSADDGDRGGGSGRSHVHPSQEGDGPGGGDEVSGSCQPNPIPPRVWRLTPLQYANTLRDSFGVQIETAQLTPDPENRITGFSNQADVIYVSEQHASEYFDLAFDVSDRLVRTLSGSSACILSDDADAECAEAFVSRFGKISLRRSLSPAERARYVAYHETARSKYGARDAARMVLAAMLQAPEFIYRTELGDGESVSTLLTAHERASAMAYGLTDAPPSAELLEAATAGALSNPDTLERWATSLATSPAGRDKFVRFVFSWLHMRKPVSDDASMDVASATIGFIEDVLSGEAPTMASLFLSSRWRINSTLGGVYAVGQSGADGQPLDLDPMERFGILTQASFLQAHQSAVKRGIALLENLLCTLPPPPPPDAANGGFPAVPGGTDAEIYTRFLETQPACATCHKTFQPLGIAFSRYDSFGRFRVENEAGRLIETAGIIVGAEDWSGAFDGARDLVEQLLESRQLSACFVRRYLTFALGVDPGDANSCQARMAAKRFMEADGDLLALQLTPILTELFDERGEMR